MIHNRKNIAIHLLMCAMGGFLGAYALILRGGNFGSASTGNLIECMISISKNEYKEVLIRLGGFALFAVPFMISKWMELRSKLNREMICLTLEIIAIIGCAFISKEAHPIVALYPIFAITSFQWSVFYGTKKYNCSTIFISNNTRQTFTSLADYMITGNKDMRNKAGFFGSSIISFLASALLCAVLANMWGPKAIVVALIYPLLTMALRLKRNY